MASKVVSETERAEALAALLSRAGWGAATRAPLAGDASGRTYERLTMGEQTAVLMDARPQPDEAVSTPRARDAERQAQGYSALARLAGMNMAAFCGLAQSLTQRGFSAPRVLDADVVAGYAVLEDLGDDLFNRVLDQEDPPAATLYGAAVASLAALRRATPPKILTAFRGHWSVLSYDWLALQAEADLLPEWYAPHHAETTVSEGDLAAWREAWRGPLAAVQADTKQWGACLVLRDVHADNLIWLPDREGHARVGLLDFQDALFGHPAYDLASLLRDARRDVAPELEEAMITRYLDEAYVEDADSFRLAYAVLTAQRSAKILGIFVRLAKRDGKSAYLEHLPRTARHFLWALEHPELAPVRDWTRRVLPSLETEARG